MQTFLPFSDFEASLMTLDYRRLGKQRVEALQIINSLIDPNYGYKHHPVKAMWEDFIPALKYYCNLSILLWESQGYQNNMLLYDVPETVEIPYFSAELYLSHRSNLIRKDPLHYSKFFPNTPSDLPYEWVKPIASYKIKTRLY
jgi:hypothetical protein